MKVIINADDFGLSPDVNNAISYCFANGYINQTTIMVNMPYVDEAVEMAKENGFFDKVGIHINLVQGQPLSDLIKKTLFCNSNGEFNNSIMRIEKRFLLTRREKKAVETEIQAQIKKYLDYGFQLKHIDSHRHAHTNVSILKILIPIAKMNGFKTIRLSRNMFYNKNGSRIKTIYKERINRVISDFNNGALSYFGTMGDAQKKYGKIEIDKDNSQDFIEIMTHPIICDGVLMDAINKISVEEWYKATIL